MEPIELDRDGTVLHALWRQGAGTPLVIIPGVMSDAKNWRRVADAIDRPEPVLILNRRGRQPSGPLGDGYSVDTEVLDLLAWMHHLKEPVRLFGWSYGGLIAIETANRTRAVDRVIAYEPILRPFAAHALPVLRDASNADDLDRVVEIVHREIGNATEEQVAALRATPAWELLRTWAAPVAGETAAINAFAPAWEDITAPVDLIVGGESRGTPYRQSFDMVAALLPAAGLHTLEKQGHLAHAEDPEALGATVTGLIAARAA
ncbi:alpha/beta fold hydrolase [Catenuloplanes japonicus]|uniref:alpha/beta fold hydrolase n=1 Tax=Catenuloplanes japonicus TaxID=33876 RepID=UPI000A4EAE7D|nr:alpha/beta hydrolase [Catenuloplanes japonicus]